MIVLGAVVTVCGSLLAGAASASPLSLAAGPAPHMTLTVSSTVVRLSEPPVLTVHMPADATGEVGFYDFARPGAGKGIGLAPVIDGVATLTAPDRPLVLGENPIRASYGGNAIYGPGDSSIVTVLTVNRLVPALTLTANSTLVLAGHKPALTVHMPADATGRVFFYLYPGGRVTLLGVASNVGGIARLTPPGNTQLVEGSNPIEAEYEGNARYEPNYSNTVTVTVIGPVQTVAFAGSQRTVPNASGGISPGSGGAGGSATTPAGTAGSGAGGGGGGAHGGLGGSGDGAGAAGGGGGSTMTGNSLLTGVTIATAGTTGNGTVTLDWLSS